MITRQVRLVKLESGRGYGSGEIGGCSLLQARGGLESL